jgi:hypothetical protein
MITNTGKAIMAKYLLGQVPSYASYVAVGCGPKPLKAISYTPTTKAVTAVTVGSVTTLTATLTVPSTHEILSGDYVTVSGVGYGLDGVFLVVSTTGTTISYITTVAAFTQEAIPSTGTAFVSKNYSNKTSLDLEMFRVPITSKGYIVESGQSKIVLTAELPSEERYEITEIGLFPSETNALNGTSGSKIISSFSTDEGWKYNGIVDIPNTVNSIDAFTTGTIEQKTLIGSTATIQTLSGSGPYVATITGLTDTSNAVIGDYITATAGTGNFGSGIVTVASILSSTSITVSSTLTFTAGTITNLYSNKYVFSTNSDNVSLSNVTRLSRFERPRFLNNSIFVQGNLSSDLVSTSNNLTYTNSNKISLPLSLDFSKNSQSDELRIGFSILNKVASASDTVSNIKILIEFVNSANSTTNYANMQIDLSQGTSNGTFNFANNRYVVVSKKLNELRYSNTFSWASVDTMKVYVLVTGSAASNQYYVALDMLRLENLSQINPTYGLIGYTQTKNLSADLLPIPIVKNQNTSNLVEFRFNMDVL